MNVLAFDNRFTMEQHLANAKAHGLHPMQETLTWGSPFVRFMDIGAHKITFGHVLPEDAIIDLAVDKGLTTEKARECVEAARAAQEKGILYSRYYDFWRFPEGQEGVMYKAHVWPIEESLYFQASEADWYISRLPTSGQINLNAAWSAFRGYMKERHG